MTMIKEDTLKDVFGFIADMKEGDLVTAGGIDQVVERVGVNGRNEVKVYVRDEDGLTFGYSPSELTHLSDDEQESDDPVNHPATSKPDNLMSNSSAVLAAIACQMPDGVLKYMLEGVIDQIDEALTRANNLT